MKILLAFCLLAGGYILGSIEKPSSAQETIYGYDNQGKSWSSHQLNPGGPTYYYGNNGVSGMYLNPSPTLPSTKNPC